MMKNNPVLIFLFILLLSSCTGGEPNLPFSYNTNPKYSWGYVEFFGSEYARYNIKNNLLSISLFSDSLSVDSTGTLNGLGQQLYLEDVYVSPTDTILPSKTFTISDTHSGYTVTPGKNDTVGNQTFPIGSYITYYEENSSNSTMKLITSGSFTVTRTGTTFNITCNFKTADKKDLKGSFTGTLPHFNEALTSTTVQRSRVRHFFQRD